MKKEIIDGYEVYSENGEFKKIIFKNYEGKEVCVSIEKCLKIEFLERKKEECSMDHEKRRHFDSYINCNDYLFEEKISTFIPSPEEIVIENDIEKRIIQEIWNLPSPQNRRVYMYIVDDISLTSIAKIENRAIPVIKKNIDKGINTLRKKLNNFYKRG